ncbi:hypothetical protein [Sphingopyxis macrogoltabida]|uniref:Uncharacterized protein n=1 Tax=Sphingopyxis macrogoltabida TaxID=33050 RepID=A0AAC9AVP5_SPHMC|nr:hypothetical protein [Sphingopyxis macrogoltabida]ALJ14231.1 hypothetical protein LH19_15280 [Sphingopyxis macrogoltabida]AMU90497.1 hypothetical protein ATM17_15855 [Sphingopyxis macrogoltabida]
MTKAVDAKMLRIAISAVRPIEDELRTQLRALHTGRYDADGRRNATSAALDGLTKLGFTIVDNASVFAIRLGGLRAESTTGVLGAMTNWLRAAEAKIGAAA